MAKAAWLSLAFFGLLGFVNAIHHPFVHDDVVFILQDPHIDRLDLWPEAFKAPSLKEGINTYYRPVLEIVYRLEYQLFGPNPYGFHLFNVLVHIANGLLLFGLLQKLNIRLGLSWATALFFLIHPVQTEAVSCIAGISNLWMALGVLLALHAYLNRRHTASLLYFTLAFLSKEQALLFVPLVLVVDLYRNQKNYGWWVFVITVSLVLLWLRQNITHASVFQEIMTSPGELYLRLAAIPRVIGMDLRMIFFPYDLHYYRSTDILQSNTMAWLGALLAAGGTIYVFARRVQARGIMILGGGWFVASLLPVLNITPLINEYSFILTPEHFLYLPIVGILLIVVVAADHFLKPLAKVLLVIAAAGCLLLTWYQNTFWKSEIILFQRMLRFEPDFGRGQLLLAKAYYFNRQPQEADGHFQKAFRIISGYEQKATNATARGFYAGFLKEILFDWAHNDSAMGRWPQALGKYRQAAALDSQDASLYNNMAFVYLQMGDKNEARVNLEQALRVDPSFAQARENLRQLKP